MRFEKWQALGNDYLIVEAAGVDPDEVRALCDRHLGVGADGVLALAPADEPGFVARLRIFNPDGSEAELSGNGAREAILYLRQHGWTESDTFSIQTVAGEIRPTITGERTCRVDMGRAIVRFDGEIGGMRFQHLTIGNPQSPIRIADREELEALDLAKLGPPIEHHDAFPNRTNVSFWTELAPDRIRARIFERGVGETMSSRHRRERRRGRARAARRRLAGDRRARRRRARGRRRRGPARRPHRLGASRCSAAS